MSSITTLWFIPGEGIERAVISSSIQRYLGNDATVRPGMGKDDYEGVPGYWIKAFRNLTSSQAEDLRIASTKYRSEMRRTQAPPPSLSASDSRMTSDLGGGYASHPAYQAPHGYTSTGPPRLGRPGGDSPIGMDTGYSAPPARVSSDRYGGQPPPHRGNDIDVDMDAGYGQPVHRRYEDDQRRFADARPYELDRPMYHDARPPYNADPYAYRPTAGSGTYGSDPRTSQGMDYRPDTRGAPQYGGGPPGPGYPRQADAPFGYPPGPPATAPPSSSHMQPPFGSLGGYPPGPPPGRLDSRDPRYLPQASSDFSHDRDGQRYAYPSPPVTVVGGRDAIPSAPSPSGYPGSGPAPTSSSLYGYDSRAGIPPPSTTTAGYTSAASGVYGSNTSPSTIPRQAAGRRGEEADDGEPPSRRARYG